MELISVIVPVYNVEKYLEKCLSSIINQTYKNIEIIIINDGSTDASGVICDKYAALDERVKVIHKKNNGISEARNSGLDRANGEYIVFVDSDDYAEPEMLEFLMAQLKKYDSDISICGFNYSYPDSNTADANLNMINEGCITGNEFWHQFYSGARVLYVTPWAKLFKRKLWQDLRFPEGKLHEDEFVVHHFIENADKIAVSKEPLYNYVQREKSVMHSKFATKNFDAAEGILLRCEYFCEKGDFALAWKSLTMAMYNIIRGLLLFKTPTADGKKRVKELKKDFWRLYRKLFFKKTDFLSKIKCGIFCINTKLFMLFKRG